MTANWCGRGGASPQCLVVRIAQARQPLNMLHMSFNTECDEAHPFIRSSVVELGHETNEDGIALLVPL